MKRITSVSLKPILVLVVLLLGTVPLLLMTTIVRSSVKDNTIKHTTVLTQGILNQSQKYLDVILKDLNIFSTTVSENKELLVLLEENNISSQSIKSLVQLKNSSKNIGDMVLIDIDGDVDSVLINKEFKDGKLIHKDLTLPFLNSQKAILLKENDSRVLWLGTPPKGISGLTSSIWNYRIIKTEIRTFILAISLNSVFLKGLLDSIEESTESEVRIITPDNIIYPYDETYFDYSFSGKTLSRSDKGRFITFSSSRIKNDKREKLLIHLYSDPIYFYNLIVITTEKSLLRGLDTISRTTTVVLIVLIFISICIGLIAIMFLQNRIKELITGVRNVYKGTYNILMPSHKINIKEDISITHAIIEVAKDVSANRERLKNINSNLEQMVIDRSKEVLKIRESLVHSKNMASIGHNAAKVAHEINNPLSICITASTHLSNIVMELNNKYENDVLTKTFLLEFLSSATEVTQMIENNLFRASELSSNFKNFAADQSSNEIRSIDLKKYIQEIITSYSYKLKNKSYKIIFTCENEVEIRTYPLIIYQAITNLINNSLLHGFDNKDKGVINLSVEEDSKCITILVKDDGIGISREHLYQLYEPFFTTKQSSGGTGLGLNIIKDLIESKLNGIIECQSELGIGTAFNIKIPKGE